MREKLRELFEARLRAGLNKGEPLTPEGIELMIERVLTYLEGSLKDLPLGPELDTETIRKRLKDSEGYLDRICEEAQRYVDYRKKIDEAYQESQNWGDVFGTHVYEYVEEAQEAFIEAVEEKYQTKVRDAKHLSELTGITELYNYWDNGGFLEDEQAEALAKKTKRPLKSFKATPKQSRDEALRQLEETLTTSRSAKYHRALYIALQSGAKYEDLMAIDPGSYGLTTEPWQTWGMNTRKASVLMTIGDAFLMYEPGGLMLRPGLRAIAEEVQAPYSEIMEAYKLIRRK